MEVSRRALLQTSLSAVLLGNSSQTQAATLLKNGVDLSWVANYEAAGGKYYSSSGRLTDPFALLKSVRASVARIRVFVAPSYRNGRLSDALLLAERAKKAGLEVCIDLHYSDDWADPGKQITPAGWSTTSVSLLATQVANYTASTLNEFKKRGINVDYVQLGNEISNGFLWPLGRIDSANPTQWQNFKQLYIAATAALRQTLPTAKNVLHLDCGGSDDARTRWWLYQTQIYRFGDYDMVGVSYYPQWSGDLTKLTKALEVISWEFDKKVVIAETSYPYTSQSFGNDVYNTKQSQLKGYPLTTSGQSAYLKKLKTIVKALPNNNGVGIWWWEGLAGRVSNNNLVLADFGVTNSALIDTRARALPALSSLSG